MAVISVLPFGKWSIVSGTSQSFLLANQIHRGITRLFCPILLFIVVLHCKINQCQDRQWSGLLRSEVVCRFESYLYHITCCLASVMKRVEFVNSNSSQFILGQGCLKDSRKSTYYLIRRGYPCFACCMILILLNFNLLLSLVRTIMIFLIDLNFLKTSRPN